MHRPVAAVAAGVVLGRWYFKRVGPLSPRLKVALWGVFLVPIVLVRLVTGLSDVPLVTLLCGLFVLSFVAALSYRTWREAEAQELRERGRSLVLGMSISALTLSLIACGLGAAEVSLRARDPEAFQQDAGVIRAQLWNEGPCYREDLWINGGKVLRPVPGRSRWGGSTDVVPIEKRPGVLRVAVVGESSAGQMESFLGALNQLDDCPIELLRCATAGGDLRQVERRFNEVLGYSPDVVSVIFGHNLFTDNSALEDVWPYQWVVSRSALLSALVRTKPMPRHLQVHKALPARLTALGETLARFAVAARARHTALVVSTMTPNLRFVPVDSVAIEDPAVYEARFLDALGRPAEAAAALRPLAALAPKPVYEYMLGSLLLRAGSPDEAREHFWRAVEADPNRFRATRAINDTLRKAARDGGFLVRDTVEAVSREAPDGIPGWESLRDHCHLRSSVMMTEAVSLFSTYPGHERCPRVGQLRSEHGAGERFLREARKLRFEESFSDILSQLERGAWHEELWASQFSELVAEECQNRPGEIDHEVDELLLGSSTFHALSPNARALSLMNVAVGYFRGRRPDRAFSTGEMAEALAASSAVRARVLVQRGEMLLASGRREEAKAVWQRAAALEPDRGDVHFFLRRLAELP